MTKQHGNKGKVPWNKGKKMSKEYKEAFRQKLEKSNKSTNLSKALKGRNITWGKKISKALKGQESAFKGKHHTKEAKEKLRAAGIKRGNKLKRDLGGRLRKSAKYAEWRAAVYKRDNYNCANDITHTERLNADHIIPFSKIMKDFFDLHKDITDQNRLYMLAINYKPLWDVSNGRTLCEPCHIQTDTFGGKARCA